MRRQDQGVAGPERTPFEVIAKAWPVDSVGNAKLFDNALKLCLYCHLVWTGHDEVHVRDCIAVGAILFLIFGLLVAGVVVGIMLGVVGFGIGFLLPEFWLGNKIKARQKVILKMIPDTLDLLTISVRAGLGFDGALAKVVEKLPGPLTDEFRRALAEVRVGKARREALRDMVPRTNVQPLSNFIGAIIQAEQLGVSISKVLQVQSEQLRIERRQRAEEMAARAPIKMLFPLVGCIFPSLFIVILGPALISIVKTMGSGVVP